MTNKSQITNIKKKIKYELPNLARRTNGTLGRLVTKTVLIIEFLNIVVYWIFGACFL